MTWQYHSLYTQEKLMNMPAKKHVHRSFVHNSQNLEIIEMSINSSKYLKIMMYSHCKIQ